MLASGLLTVGLPRENFFCYDVAVYFVCKFIFAHFVSNLGVDRTCCHATMYRSIMSQFGLSRLEDFARSLVIHDRRATIHFFLSNICKLCLLLEQRVDLFYYPL